MKKYIFALIVIVYIILSIYIIFFVLYKTHKVIIKTSNVSKPISNSTNMYAISYNEQIIQNLNEISTAFFKSNYKKLHISKVSTFISTVKNNKSGTVPLCKPLVSSAPLSCTSLSSIYSSIKKHINKLNIDLKSPHSIANYYIVLFNRSYYFVNDNYQKTIYNNGFPIYYIE